jgi:hypothetical protein
VRVCGAQVSSGALPATSVGEGHKRAIAAWMKVTRAGPGERFTSWRLAINKSIGCRPAPDTGLICEARASPCVIEQAPAQALPPNPRAPEPKVIPVPPAKAIKA